MKIHIYTCRKMPWANKFLLLWPVVCMLLFSACAKVQLPVQHNYTFVAAQIQKPVAIHISTAEKMLPADESTVNAHINQPAKILIVKAADTATKAVKTKTMAKFIPPNLLQNIGQNLQDNFALAKNTKSFTAARKSAKRQKITFKDIVFFVGFLIVLAFLIGIARWAGMSPILYLSLAALLTILFVSLYVYWLHNPAYYGI